MENAQQLAHRFKEVMLDGKWIANTNYQEQIKDLSWQEATQKIGTLNTIAQLTFHMNYYVKGVMNVFKGGALEIRDKYSFAMQQIDAPEPWESLKNELLENCHQFSSYIEKMTNKQLDSPFVDQKYGSYRRNIEGMIEHAYYHLGQISLLRKMQHS